LDEAERARTVCEKTVPVLTGIGHDRYSTSLYEIANIRFDTPSKVIAGIERTIKLRADEARQAFAFVATTAQHAVKDARRLTEQLDVTIRSQAQRQISGAREQSERAMHSLRLATATALNEASNAARTEFSEVSHGARRHLELARRNLPDFLSRVTGGAERGGATARSRVQGALDTVVDRTRLTVSSQRSASQALMSEVSASARRTVAEASTRSEALVREIAGQGPNKALSRGFAIVRDEHGNPVTSAQVAMERQAVQIQFHDGRATADIQSFKKDPQP